MSKNQHLLLFSIFTGNEEQKELTNGEAEITENQPETDQLPPQGNTLFYIWTFETNQLTYIHIVYRKLTNTDS